MITYDEALRIVLECSTREMPVETVPLVLAPHRVLAESIIATENIPASPNSAMDGYAVRASDLAGARPEQPASLDVVDEASAGSTASLAVTAGRAIRIMTGGLLPDGADAVIEVESTSESGGIVLARRAVRPGEAVRAAGEDVRAGEEVLAAGRRLTAGDIGVLAALGVVNVPVRVPPKVGILSTGNELVETHRRPAHGQLRNSSSPALYAMCADAGAEPIDLGIARDDRGELEDKIGDGLRFDVLITTGGVSAGAYDHVQHVIPALGVEVKFHKTRIKPGKPVLFGVHTESGHATLVFALPGNPVSTLVTFRQFVRPALQRLLRQRDETLRLHLPLAVPLKKADDRRHFIRGIVARSDDGNVTVRSTGTQSSGAMSSMSRANCLIILPEDAESLAAGDLVDVEML